MRTPQRGYIRTGGVPGAEVAVQSRSRASLDITENDKQRREPNPGLEWSAVQERLRPYRLWNASSGKFELAPGPFPTARRSKRR